MSLFEALYGRSPRSFGLSVPNVPKAHGLEEWLQERKTVTALIKQHLSCASLQMKSIRRGLRDTFIGRLGVSQDTTLCSVVIGPQS
jgi:hypothetical protein